MKYTKLDVDIECIYCGTPFRCKMNNYLSGNTTSCGCKGLRQKQLNGLRNITHGHSSGGKYSPTYISWNSLKMRCNNPKATDYCYYGGRGIKCNYKSFEEFLADVGKRPNRLYSIDRINPDGHYEVGNCRWATWHEQALNRRTRQGLLVG